jgi:hypothetical protein
MLTLTGIKKFIKKYWGILVGSLALVLYFFWKKKPDTDTLPSDIIQSGKQLSHDVDTARDTERTALDEEDKQHSKKTEEIKIKYEEKKDQLDAATKAEAERLFVEYKDDPEGLAEELSIVTGFRVVIPKD